MIRLNKIFIIGLVTLPLLHLSVPAQALVQVETFPSASSFDSSLGSEIATEINDIKFVNIIPKERATSDILVVNSTGKGAIVAKEQDRYRTYTGINWNRVPQSQVISDITDDNVADIISLLPAQRSSSKEWHYAKISSVASDYFVINEPLRRNILADSIIIAPNGKQYVVSKNNGPQGSAENPSPYNAIFLAHEVDMTAPLPAYTTFMQANSYIAYLLPTNVVVEAPQLVVHTNTGKYNFTEAACRPYIPSDIDTITDLLVGDMNRDRKKDLVLVTHPRTMLSASQVQKSYNADQHILTFTITANADLLQNTNLTGSYFSFFSFPDQLFHIRSNTSTTLTVDFTLPTNAEGREILESNLLAGDRFFVTLNNDESKKNLVYLGDNKGCFIYAGAIKGTVVEMSYGKIVLPGADQPTDSDRSVITDTNAHYLPTDSLANREITLGDTHYTIEHNDQAHIYLNAAAGDLRSTVSDVIHSQTPTQYSIEPLTNIPEVNMELVEQLVSVYRDVPAALNNLIDAIPLGMDLFPRPIDIDLDTDIDLLFLHENHLFLKLNNERST